MKISMKLQFKKNIFNKKLGRNISNFSKNDRFKFVTDNFKEYLLWIPIILIIKYL